MSYSNKASRSPRLWLIAGALLGACLLAWWLWPAEEKKGAVVHGPWSGPVPVRLTEVTRGDYPVQLKALGTVTALNTVNVRARVNGELVKVMFEEGQQVKAGDVLAQIDPRPYQVALQQAEGALVENQAQLKNAEIDLARYEGLYAEDSIAKQTLDTQRALVGQYRGTVKTNQAAVAEAKLNLDFTRIRAPLAGRLGLRQVDVGNLVTSSDTTPLVVITQVEPIAVNFTLPEKDLPPVLARVRQGEQLKVEAWDRSEQQKLAVGDLHSLDNQIDVATGTVKIKARFANADETLFPNQFINVRLQLELRQGVTLIPSAALQYGARGTFVFVLGKDNKVEIRDVRVTASDGPVTQVEQGVNVGERLVLEGTDQLKNGSEVQVIGDEPGAVAQPGKQAEQKRGA